MERSSQAESGSGTDRDRLGLPILLDAAHELVVVKPAGMATELTSDPKGVSLISRVRSALPAGVTPRLPHRLDRVTRGLVVVALTDEAIAFHNEQIRAGAWEKIYLARVVRSGLESFGALMGAHTLHLRRVRGRAEVVRSGGKRAITELLAWAPAPDHDDEAHVLIRLHTGRYHQIRATMAALGAPVVDDWLYGRSEGRGRERFVLEHIALRFTLYGWDHAVAVHRERDPDREAIGQGLRLRLADLVSSWVREGAERIGGDDAEEHRDQGAGR